MELIKKQEVLDGVPENWKRQYSRSNEVKHKFITQQLQLLQKPLKTSDIDAIIGNSYWTQLKCDECNRDVELLVQVGQEPDYESRTACLCKDCLYKAFDMASKGECQL